MRDTPASATSATTILSTPTSAAASNLFPNAMLHWEDFGASNARRILNQYADQVCTFNDDMQGTAAVVLAAALAAIRAAGTRMRDQRVVIHGAGTAGLGIADMMRDVMIGEGLSLEDATAAVLRPRQPRAARRRLRRRCATSRCPTPGPRPRSPGGRLTAGRSTSLATVVAQRPARPC